MECTWESYTAITNCIFNNGHIFKYNVRAQQISHIRVHVLAHKLCLFFTRRLRLFSPHLHACSDQLQKKNLHLRAYFILGHVGIDVEI